MYCKWPDPLDFNLFLIKRKALKRLFEMKNAHFRRDRQFCARKSTYYRKEFSWQIHDNGYKINSRKHGQIGNSEKSKNLKMEKKGSFVCGV